MTVRVEQDCDSPQSARVKIAQGEPFAVTMRVDGSKSDANAALKTALTGRTWLSQGRLTPGAADPPLLTLAKTETVDGDVLTLVFSCADTSPLLADRLAYFDAKVTSGPKAGGVFFDGSTVFADPTASRPA